MMMANATTCRKATVNMLLGVAWLAAGAQTSVAQRPVTRPAKPPARPAAVRAAAKPAPPTDDYWV